jgi:catechol 2,3-dioxygenase-like lactoylglutathione lyase family enzyme
MSVRGLDHIAITVADIDTTLEFYRRVLDATTHFEALYRSGQIPVVILQVGASRLSIHDAAKPASPHAARPTPGSGDICFRWDGSIEAAAAHLKQLDVAILDGPVARPAADGQAGQSVYFRDPDGNLLELLSTG